MVEFFLKLFSTDFVPHAYCLRLPGLIQLHVWSDLVIAAAYALIPIALFRLVRYRRDLIYPWMFVLFGLFIFSCGMTHVLAAWTLWHPIYRFDGLVKAFTAIVSLLTAILLIGIVPQILQIPSAEMLRKEIAERTSAEEQVKTLNAELEGRIQQRTRELSEAHERLAQSERRRLMAVEAAGVGTWFWNLQSGEVFWDHNARSIFGLPTQAVLIFDDFYGAVHPEDLPQVQASVDEARLTGNLSDIEFRVVRRDGSERWVRSRGSTDAEEGTVARTLQGTVIDITEQKRTELGLGRLASIVESSDDAIIGLDLKGKVTSWNGSAERTFGFEAAEIVGQAVSVLAAPNQPDDTIEMLQRLRHHERIEHFETVRRRKSGGVIDISLTVSPITNEAGRTIGASLIARDISRRKETDAALRNSEELFRTLAEAVPDILFIADSNGIITFISARFYEELGLDPQTTDPHSAYSKSVHPEDGPRVTQLWNECVREQKPFQAEFRMRKKAGGYRWVVTRSLPIVDERKSVLQWIGASTDIDQFKKVERALVQSNDELRQFAYAAAHDLQEPLRNVVNAAGMLTLRAGERLDPASRQYLQFCIEGAERMHGMVKDLLAFTTVVEGAVSPGAYARAGEILRDVEANLAFSLADANARLLASGLPDVAVEPTHLTQLFQNIIGNALKYRSPDRAPVIRVGAVRDADHWRFEIADNGIGFRPEYRGRIFGVFKRLHPQHEYSGSGIGLAICARIVAHYGGRIWADGTPGEGATFYFTLPDAAENSAVVSLYESAPIEATG
jgi:PAS domain S-box-containing protein